MLSVIIPTLNAEETLPSTLACLGAARIVSEIIVVDGGSTDRTLELASAAGAVTIDAPRGRGIQLQMGADYTHRNWLLFLHADTVLTGNWEDAMRRHMILRRARAGYFNLQFDDRSLRSRLWAWGVGLRCALLALPYGDQGLLIHRDLYRKVGGFKDLPIMEDIDLVRRLGRRRLRGLAATAVTSAIRYRRDGYVKRSLRNWNCLLRFLFGQSPAAIVQLYEGAKDQQTRDVI